MKSEDVKQLEVNLTLDKHPEMTDSAIADICGVSDGFVCGTRRGRELPRPGSWPSHVLTPDEKDACLLAMCIKKLEPRPLSLADMALMQADLVNARAARLRALWEETRKVSALMAWSDAVAEETRILRAAVSAERASAERTMRMLRQEENHETQPQIDRH